MKKSIIFLTFWLALFSGICFEIAKAENLCNRDSLCGDGNQYSFVLSPHMTGYSWDDAKEYCENRGLLLAVIPSDSQKEWCLLKFLKAETPKNWKFFHIGNNTNAYYHKDIDGHQCNVGTGDPIYYSNIICEPVSVLINAFLNLDNIDTYYNPTPVLPDAPAGVFTITATFSNISNQNIKDIFFEVAQLTGGNLVLNAEVGPGGVGALVIVPNDDLNGDEVLTPEESFIVEFIIGLAVPARFYFFVDAYGIVGM